MAKVAANARYAVMALAKKPYKYPCLYLAELLTSCFSLRDRGPKGNPQEVEPSDRVVRGAELGVKEGDNVRYLLHRLPEVSFVGVDTWCRRPEQKDVSGGETYNKWPVARYEAKARAVAEKFPGRLRLLKLTTHEASEQFEPASFDFVYIDAAHDYASVKQDIEDWLPLVREDGFLIGHDYGKKVQIAVDEAFGKRVRVLPKQIWYVKV